MGTDTTHTLEIPGSPWAMAKFALMGLALTGVSAAMALGLPGDNQPGGFHVFIGYVGLIFFGLCTAVIFWRMLTGWRAVVTLAPQGIRDRRVAAGFIPWAAIRNISTWQNFNQRVMVLTIDPAVERDLRLTLIARLTRTPNRSLGINGLCVTAHGLRIDYDDLIVTTRAYARAAQNQPLRPNGRHSTSAKIYKLH